MKKIMAIAFALMITSQIVAQVNLSTLHSMLVKFYGYQRAGLKTGSANNLNSGFTNASHGGDNYNGSPLDGGWYDAGDYIKFGMPLGYTVYCLLKGYDVFPSAYADNYSGSYGASDKIPDILNEVKFATDYLIKAVINENTIVLDVGKADEEHRTWGVVNPSGRSGDKIVLCTGADVPATYAACLALMSTLYRKHDATYADLCLEKAVVAFKFAKKKYEAGGSSYYCNPQKKDNKALYDYPTVNNVIEKEISDKIVACGVELFRATKAKGGTQDPVYKTWASKSISGVFNCMGYTFVGPLASFEAWRQGLGDIGGLMENIGFVGTRIQKTGVFNTVYLNSGWGTAREAGTAAFEYALAYVTTSSETMRATYLTHIKNHVNWVTGYSTANNYKDGKSSWVIGFNSSKATNIHYRSNKSGPQGGVVSGPNIDGAWNNDGSADFCEVAIDYNAGITGAVAFLKALENPGTDIKVPTTFSATPASSINFSNGGVTFKAGFSASVPWILTITGSSGSKTIKKTGSTVNEIWDGSADNGMFLGGETVVAKLETDAVIVAYDILKLGALQMTLTKMKNVSAGTDDKLLDDFADSDSINKLGGKWLPVSSATGFSATSLTYGTQDGSVAVQTSGTVTSNLRTTYSGLKTTFNGSNSAGGATNLKSILFDMKASKSANVFVELEQSSITDGAYHSFEIPVTTIKNTYNLNIADFKQPDSKTSAVALDLSKVTSIRFVVYDSIGSVKLHLDNVYTNGASSAVRSTFAVSSNQIAKVIVSQQNITYQIPQSVKGTVEMMIFNIAGQVALKKAQTINAGGIVSLSLSHLPNGMYTVVNSINGKVAGDKIKFVHTK